MEELVELIGLTKNGAFFKGSIDPMTIIKPQERAKKSKAQVNSITHCVECRKRHTSDCPLSSSLQLRLADDWFCADGEK